MAGSAAPERRKYPRFACNEPVRLSLLSDQFKGKTLDATIVGMSQGGLRIETSLNVPVGTLIKMEGKDTLFLGEVVYCQGDEPVLHLGIILTRALYGLTELRRIHKPLQEALRPTAETADDLVEAGRS
ncbi:hypothetical protein F183_A25690 [Bryobacterales bacterium F-183]|nr:hypothetical protein F183_A25690 [Bryobacterales bacterium F-183]